MTPRALAAQATRVAIAGCLMSVFWAPGPAPAAVNPRAPQFKTRDVRGTVLDLEALRRKGPVLVDFWATWCKPCLSSLTELERWHHEYGPNGLTVIGVSVDGPRNQAKVRPFAARMGLTYPIVVDRDDRLKQLYQVVAIPTAFLIDTSGAITQVRLGYVPGEGEKLEGAIRALLGQGTPPDAEDGASRGAGTDSLER